MLNPSEPIALPTTLEAAQAEIRRLRSQVDQLETVVADATSTIRTARNWLEQVADGLSQGLILLNSAGQITLLNEASANLLGLAFTSDDQWVGYPIAQVAAQAKLNLFTRRVQALLHQPESILGEQLDELPDGRLLVCDSIPGFAYADGTEPGFLLCLREISSHPFAAKIQQLLRMPDQNPNPIFCFGSHGDTVYTNPVARQLTKLASPQERVRVRQQMQQKAAQALADGEKITLDVAYGDQIYRAEVLPFAAEEYATIYLFNVTAQRRAEAELAQQRQFYETILDELPVEVAVLDADRRYLYTNPHAVPDPGARQWLVGHTIDEFCQRYDFPQHLAEQRQRMFTRALTEHRLISWEDITPTPDGPRCHQRHFKTLRGANGSLHLMLGYGLDITDQVEAEHQLAQQQTFMQQVLDTTPSAIFVRDAEGKIIFQNKATRQLLEDRVRRHTVARQDPNSPEAREIQHYTQADAAVLASGRELRTEDPYTLASGEVRWYQTNRRALLSDSADQALVLGVSTDVTELKLAMQEAQAAVTARENFLANMSHEIRTPLNGVLGMAGQLAKTSLDAHQQNLLQVILSSGRHLLAVLNDVLDMAKISSGKLEFEQSSFNLCESMSQAVGPLLLLAREKGLEVTGAPLRDSCPNTWVVGDAFRLNQILINLVSNAIKFTESGSIDVGGYLIAETATHMTTEFRVKDTGIGVAPDKLSHIFEGFTQAYADTTRRFGGTGLGLSISRALVEQLGGTLTVESQHGQGSTFAFSLTLPKADAPSTAEPAAFINTDQLRGRRALLVEDNEINRDVARMMLEEWGLVVEEAHDGEAAVALHAAHPYDIVLMDIQMPIMNGMEATGHIRQHPDSHRAQVPILALTANAFRAHNEQYLAVGMNDYLAKPFEEAELHAKLLALLQTADTPRVSYDLTGLRELARGKQAFIEKILRSFLAHMPATITQMRAAAAAEQWQKAAELVHHIKPNLIQLRVAGVEEAIRQLEQLPVAIGSGPVRQAAMGVLTSQLERVLHDLAAEVPPVAAAPKS